jgi:hypothetical protein
VEAEIIANRIPALEGSEQLITVKVPPDAVNGQIMVERGEMKALSDGDFIVDPADNVPAIERFSPTTGREQKEVRTAVRIFGVNLDKVTRVRFSNIPAEPVVTSDIDSRFRKTAGVSIASNLVSEASIQLEFEGTFVTSGKKHIPSDLVVTP